MTHPSSGPSSPRSASGSSSRSSSSPALWASTSRRCCPLDGSRRSRLQCLLLARAVPALLHGPLIAARPGPACCRPSRCVGLALRSASDWLIDASTLRSGRRRAAHRRWSFRSRARAVARSRAPPARRRRPASRRRPPTNWTIPERRGGYRRSRARARRRSRRPRTAASRSRARAAASAASASAPADRGHERDPPAGPEHARISSRAASASSKRCRAAKQQQASKLASRNRARSQARNRTRF